MSPLGKWLLGSFCLHLMLIISAVALFASEHKPVPVIDLSRFGHSWYEAKREHPVGGAVTKAATAVQPVPTEIPAPLKRSVPSKRLASKPNPIAQQVEASDAGVGNDSPGAASAGSIGTGSPGSSSGNGSEAGGQGGYRGRYYGFITELVQKAAIYPLQARRMGWQGIVTISFLVRQDGSITNVVVWESSGHAVLDASALAAVKKLGRLPCPPESVELHLPVVYRLNG